MAHRRRFGKKHTSRSRFEYRRKKRKTPYLHNQSFPAKRRKKEESLFVAADDIIGFIYTHDGIGSLKEIIIGLDLPRTARKEAQNLLAALCHEKVLSCDKKGYYSLSRKIILMEGIISAHPRGFAFAAVENPPPGLEIDRDVFIPAQELRTAHHGDRVLLTVIAKRRNRVEARVVRVLERTASKLVGIFMTGRTTGLVIPEDDRFAFQIVVQRKDSRGARNGEAVVTEIHHFPLGHRNPSGKIVEILGDPDDLNVQNEIVVHKFDIPHEFSDEAAQQIARFDDAITLEPGRSDLRDILHVTIDGETAKDFDDAVGIEKIRNGHRLYVSIADVGKYVSPGTPLDKEAYLRGTSVYFPNRVVPMLPERLSNDLCSLVPNQDRYAFTAVLDFDRSGKRKKKTFARSLIKSSYRLTYTVVKNILVDRDASVRGKHKPLLTPLQWMAELAEQLEKRRMERGSLGFEIPEAEFVIDSAGKVSSIKRFERNMAHKLIEEFMLAANEAVAETLAKESANKAEVLYRIHEAPDPVKVAEFTSFSHSLGLKLPANSGTPQWFANVLTQVAGTPREYIINNLLLRAMQQARYSSENVGHFGLAASHYTHFTSPIRRYPDLMVHRALAKYIATKKIKKLEKRPSSATSEAGDFLSKRERVAVDAEREMVDRLKVRFMADKEGETFEGVISGATGFGLFVELLEWFVSGGVDITDLSDDYYNLDEKNHRLIGSRTGNIYQVGDLVNVTVAKVDVARRRINFTIAGP